MSLTNKKVTKTGYIRKSLLLINRQGKSPKFFTMTESRRQEGKRQESGTSVDKKFLR